MASRRQPKRKLPGTSPPKRNTKNVKNSEADCIVCDEPILEPSENCEGDEAVFCEGDCQGWIHRKCAGVTRSAFDKLGESDVQYLCSQCMLASQNREICKLANIIKDLNASIISLTETITLLQSSAKATATMHLSAPEQTTTNSTNDLTEVRVQPVNLDNMKARPTDRNLNVVIYGIDECPPRTPRAGRSKLELEKVLPVLTTIDSSIRVSSINDIHRLGKFSSSNSHPRPLLVKFLRIIDANTVLFNRDKVKHPIIIKSDMTPEERKTEAALLRERWNLIQQGVDRKVIRIRNQQIFVNKLLHGKVIDFKFIQSSPLTSTSTSSTTPDSMEHQSTSQ